MKAQNIDDKPLKESDMIGSNSASHCNRSRVCGCSRVGKFL